MAKTILYHGSYCIVQKPNLSLCNTGKDFGQGFYLTTSKKQAEKFVRTSIKKAIARKIVPQSYNHGFISKFEFDDFENLHCHVFQNADVSWLHCVAVHRKRGCIEGEFEKWSDFDLICGKIANDQTNTVIAAYIDEVYGPIMSERATKIALEFLEPEKLKDQWCFKTQKSIDCLKFISSEEV
ncbi:DUF3990 domain-containing protein [Candidatus Saccharibacteria bacterium]|jgi:hypothetical protein|nr:DUF3990 domain-containing protein [Candidatus Saccharibacteria bacterium]